VIDARIPVALGASLMLHGAALAFLDGLPRGGPLSMPQWEQFGAGALQARLRAPEVEAVAVPAPQAPAARRRAARPGAGSRQAEATPKYYPVQELDERPLIRTPVHPEFPAHAPVASGQVVLRLLISRTGDVVEATVVSASPAGVFETVSMQAFAPARFTPGRKGGAAVGSALTVELRFGEPLPVLAQSRHLDLPQYEQPRRPYRQRSTPPQEKP
jgi:hypothetical protein